MANPVRGDCYRCGRGYMFHLEWAVDNNNLMYMMFYDRHRYLAFRMGETGHG